MRLTSIGAGNMATAIIRSVISSGRIKAADITVYDIKSDKYPAFAELGVNCADSVEQAVAASEVILLAVKPQDYETVLCGIKDAVAGQKKIFISIAAAISASYICKTLGADFPVVRVMPKHAASYRLRRNCYFKKYRCGRPSVYQDMQAFLPLPAVLFHFPKNR